MSLSQCGREMALWYSPRMLRLLGSVAIASAKPTVGSRSFRISKGNANVTRLFGA